MEGAEGKLSPELFALLDGGQWKGVLKNIVYIPGKFWLNFETVTGWA